MKRLALLALAVLAVALSACGSAADTVSRNISKDAEQFRIERRIVVINGITDKPELMVTGRCSYESYRWQLVLTCKEGPNEYKKHTIGLSDNVFWTSTQVGAVNESEYRTKFIFRPESIVPNVDLVTGQQP